MWCSLAPSARRGEPPARQRILAAALLLAGLAAAVLTAGLDAARAQQGGEAPPPPVKVVTATASDVEVFEEYAGRVRGAREVEVRARVEGILLERRYQEGQVVETGDALFAIDPEPFEVALQGAEAERERATASLRQAQRQWERISSLFDRAAVSESQRDSALAELELARAQVAQAESQVRRAQLELDYTDVAAPVSGITSREAVPEGSLVERGTLLTTILQQDPVHVNFALPEDDAELQRAARRAMGRAGENGSLRRDATLIQSDGMAYGIEGVVDFTASAIDPRTGTVSARAIFANPQGLIVPGQFVRVRMLLQTLEQVITLPEAAISQGPGGTRVFVVDDADTVQARDVRLGPVVQGQQVILEGLSPGARVIVEGQVAVRPGMTVKPSPAEAEQADEAGAESDTAASPPAESAEAADGGAR